MGRLLKMVDLFRVTGRVKLRLKEYELIKSVDEILEHHKIDMNHIFKDMIIEDKSDFLHYMDFIARIGKMDGTSEEFHKCLNKIENIRQVRGKFFISDRHSFMGMALGDSSWYPQTARLDRVIRGLNILKLCELTYWDKSIYINGKKYMIEDSKVNDYTYMVLFNFNDGKKIKGNIGLIIVKGDKFEIYRDDVIKSGKDKARIIRNIGVDNLDLVISRRNVCDSSYIEMEVGKR